MRRVIRCALILAVVVGLVPVPSAAAADPDLTGVYLAQGTNPDGTQYRGFVQVVRQGASFLVSWIFPQLANESVVLERTSIGVGIASHGVFAVSCFSEHMAAVVIYRIEEDGKRLDGQWTAVGDDGVLHAETLSRLPDTAIQQDDAAGARDLARPRVRARGREADGAPTVAVR